MRDECTIGDCRVLVVDDERLACELAVQVLRAEGFEVRGTTDATKVKRIVERFKPHVVVTDLAMPETSGLQLLEWSQKESLDIAWIMVTALVDVAVAVQAMKLGAYDYITKPFQNEQLVLAVTRAVERQTLRFATTQLRDRLTQQQSLDDIIGESAALRHLRERVKLAADSDLTVLITGETGTGKELVARALHEQSPRARHPIVSVNCAALPETLAGSELFGHERGAFTSADHQRVGRFEAAQGGTIHLDEIGDLPSSTQGSLLRVLEERLFERVGSSQSHNLDVRVVAATKRDLRTDVRNGRFREDLFFRLNIMTITCPPLRDHLEDLPLLIAHFLSASHNGSGDATAGLEAQITRRALSRLTQYDWPGNVRELRNALTRASLLSGSKAIDSDDLEFAFDSSTSAAWLANPCHKSLLFVEKQHLIQVLAAHGWNQSEASRVLGIDRGTLARKIARHGLRRDEPLPLREGTSTTKGLAK